METTTKKPVNFLKYNTTAHDADGNPIYIKIRLSDDCKNGQNDFAITADIYEKGKPRADRYHISGGCCHDEILKARPDLKIFVDLHLCDVNGAPMYTAANGFYHLKNSAPEMARDYIRATAEEFEIIRASEDETIFAYTLERLGIVARWKKEAEEAIKILEEWTGEKFEDNSKKANFSPLGAKVAEVEKKIAAGYYAPEKIKERDAAKEQARRDKIAAELVAHRDKEIKQAQTEYAVKIAVHNAGLSLENFIYYNHTNEGVFNWKDYGDQVTAEEFAEFEKTVDRSALPSGIVFKIKTARK